MNCADCGKPKDDPIHHTERIGGNTHCFVVNTMRLEYASTRPGLRFYERSVLLLLCALLERQDPALNTDLIREIRQECR